MAEVERFARDGGLVLGICNGFQVLCEAGLLSGALLPNTSLRFTCRQVGARGRQRVDVVDAARARSARRCRSPPSTRPAATGRPIRCWTSSRPTARSCCATRPGENFNGSARDIAGVSNKAGNVVGLMPHPEHAVDALTGSADGLKLFESAARVPA